MESEVTVIGEVLVRRFERRDQAASQALILEGLSEHFEEVRYDLNTDLVDIHASYLDNPDADFFVADIEGYVVGTAGLLFETPAEARMVRVSTRKAFRRNGIARRLLNAVEAECSARAISVLWAYTQPEWSGAVYFYSATGFVVAGKDDVDVHLRREIQLRESSS